ITPSFMGLMATMLPGVRPNISFASLPTASTSPVTLLMATMEGSFTTSPLPRAYTSVLAVPRSMAKSLENMLMSDRRLKFFEPCERKPFDDDIVELSFPSKSKVAALLNYHPLGQRGHAALFILRSHGNHTFSRRQRRSKEIEGAIVVDHRHLLTVYHNPRAQLRLAFDFYHVTVLHERL